MKLLLIMCPESLAPELREIIDRHEVQGYTEIPEVRGSGETGKRLGTRAFPGVGSLFFTAVDEAKAQELLEAVRGFCEQCDMGESVRVFSLDAHEVI